MSPNKALVTLAIGEKYQNIWNEVCKPTWEPYADKHGYDIVVIEDYIDKSQKGERSPHWQKCLIFSHDKVQQYDHVVWLDSDIVINFEKAPCVVEKTQDGYVGAVLREDANPKPGDLENGIKRTIERNNNESIRDRGYKTPREQYQELGYGSDVNQIFNTGLMVLNQDHRPLLETVYRDYKETKFTAKEMLPLSYHLLKNEVVQGIDPRFNVIFDTECNRHYPFLFEAGVTLSLKTIAMITNTVYCNSFFLHFIQSYSRQFISLVLPGGTFPDTINKAFQINEDHDFVIGKHQVQNPF